MEKILPVLFVDLSNGSFKQLIQPINFYLPFSHLSLHLNRLSFVSLQIICNLNLFRRWWWLWYSKFLYIPLGVGGLRGCGLVVPQFA